MAKMRAPFSFQGSLSDISFYKRKDLDKVIARLKTGPTKEQINNDPRFALTKKNVIEWKGCTLGAQWVRRVLYPMEAVRDHNWAAVFSGLLKSVQKMDAVHPYGERSVQVAQHPHLLEGFPINQQTPFEGLVRTPLTASLDKTTLSAQLEVPELLPGVNFLPRTPHPYFRITASLGVVPDLHYTSFGYTPKITPGSYLPEVTHTAWLGVKSGAPASVLELSLPYAVEFPSYALVLAVAVSFGTLNAKGEISPVGYSGSGKIMAVVG